MYTTLSSATNTIDFYQAGLEVINTEAQALINLGKQLNENFTAACKILLDCKGRVVVTGMGKSGHIANKIAATFASTGTPAFFMHPGEANHGDLGMIINNDVLIVISYSGLTSEITTFLPLVKHLKIPLIAITGNMQSPIAKEASIVLDAKIDKEACPLGLAPTTSTTVALALGDALAITLLQARGFNRQDFARSHPGGNLGRRLLLKIDNIWHSGEHLPLVNEHSTVSTALIEVTAKKLGMTCVVNDNGILTGIYTDGDIRRTLTQKCDINIALIKDVMNIKCKTVTKNTLAIDALTLMQKFSITSLIVTEKQKPIAVVHLHDLLKAGIM